MKLSCIPVSFFKNFSNGRMTFKDWIEIGYRSGLDGIDISTIMIKNHTPVYIGQLNKDLSKGGIPIITVSTYPDFTHPDKIQRDRELEYLRSDIALASELGATYVRILAGQAHPKTTVKNGIKWVLENFKISANIGQKYNVVLLYENHSKPGAWKLNDFSHPTEIFLEIAEKIKNTSIKINFDTANTIVYGDDPLSVLEKIIDQVETIHAADTSIYGKLTNTLVGTGLVPFGKIFTYLKNKGFDGWISIEERSNMGLEGLKRTIDFIKKTWEHA